MEKIEGLFGEFHMWTLRKYTSPFFVTVPMESRHGNKATFLVLLNMLDSKVATFIVNNPYFNCENMDIPELVFVDSSVGFSPPVFYQKDIAGYTETIDNLLESARNRLVYISSEEETEEHKYAVEEDECKSIIYHLEMLKPKLQRYQLTTIEYNVASLLVDAAHNKGIYDRLPTPDEFKEWAFSVVDTGVYLSKKVFFVSRDELAPSLSTDSMGRMRLSEFLSLLGRVRENSRLSAFCEVVGEIEMYLQDNWGH
jgi:hypothetical protein